MMPENKNRVREAKQSVWRAVAALQMATSYETDKRDKRVLREVLHETQEALNALEVLCDDIEEG